DNRRRRACRRGARRDEPAGDHRAVRRRRGAAPDRLSPHARLPARRGGMRSAAPIRRMTAPPRPSGAAAARLLARRAGLAMGNAYSRRVARLKVVLPALGLGLLLLVAMWPRLAPLWERMRFPLPALDLRDARELRMLNPRYAGTGREVPDRSDLMSLEAPQAELKTHNGATVVVTAATGIYQSQAQLLDLFGDV